MDLEYYDRVMPQQISYHVPATAIVPKDAVNRAITCHRDPAIEEVAKTVDFCQKEERQTLTDQTAVLRIVGEIRCCTWRSRRQAMSNVAPAGSYGQTKISSAARLAGQAV
jgi:hypothetical protein